MSSMKPLVFGFLLVGLFAIALISFGIRLADVNEVSQSIGDDPAIKNYADSLNNSIAQASSDSQTSQEAISESPITLGESNFVIDAIGGIWKTITEVPVTVWNLTVGLLLAKIFGDNSFAIALSVIGTLIGFAVIFAVVKWLSTGENE